MKVIILPGLCRPDGRILIIDGSLSRHPDYETHLVFTESSRDLESLEWLIDSGPETAYAIALPSARLGANLRLPNGGAVVFDSLPTNTPTTDTFEIATTDRGVTTAASYRIALEAQWKVEENAHYRNYPDHELLLSQIAHLRQSWQQAPHHDRKILGFLIAISDDAKGAKVLSVTTRDLKEDCLLHLDTYEYRQLPKSQPVSA